jgi:F-type H+-transporting ATPase subunit gamma
MGAQLRIYRRRMRSVKATKKITKAMELISAFSSTNHPLTTESANPKRAAVLIITADRGMAGAYSNAAIKEGDQLIALLESRGLEVNPYIVGRKGINFYKFRNRKISNSWSGFSDNPTYAHAKEVSDSLISAFIADAQTDPNGVDELHIIYTEFKSMITQTPDAKRMLPLEVVESTAPTGLLPQYEFEPDAGEVLNALLPRYIQARVFNAMLQSAASEHAARRRAMKSATDNADELIKSLTRLANAARQAEITQEISEIVGGADALASASAGSE